MNDRHASGKVARPVPSRSASSREAGTVMAWTSGSGDSEKSHILHIGPEGMAWALGLTNAKEFAKLVGETTGRASEAAAIIEAHKRGRRLSREQVASVLYTKDLKQLTIIDDAGKKQKIENGSEGEQEQIFAAVEQYLGGEASEDEADAWSVMQGPLVALGMTALIGGLAIFLAADADPNYEPTGRRSGMKQLINWIGYTVGPMWMSVIVGVIAVIILGAMAAVLVKRPKRQVLTF